MSISEEEAFGPKAFPMLSDPALAGYPWIRPGQGGTESVELKSPGQILNMEFHDFMRGDFNLNL